MSELEDHGCFTMPTSSSTPNKSGPQQHCRSSSTDSRLSTMPLDAGLYNSFSYSGPTGFYRGGATPMTSVAGLYHVSSNAWQPPGLTSPPATQTLSMEQSTEIFNLVMECQVLSTDLAKQFHKLSGLRAMHCTPAQATAHKTSNVGWMAQNVAYSILPDGQTQDKKQEETLQQLCTEADKAWKDTNDLVFQHQLHYDEQLTTFISDAERTLQDKQDKVWVCVHRLVDVAGVPHDAYLGLALQVLDKLPTIPIDLTYHTPIPMMLAYGPESCAYQTWCQDEGGTSALSRDARASCILLWRLEWLSHGEGVDDSSPDRCASPAHSTCSAVPHSPRHSSSKSCSGLKSFSPQNQ